MALIEWRDEFSLGIPDVDYEHREMISLINELYERVRTDPSTDAVMEFMGEIYARIAAHFALEEKIMREGNYDQYQDHKTDHERLLDDIRDLMDDYEDGYVFSDVDFSRRLNDWFSVHFSTHDARLHRHFGG